MIPDQLEAINCKKKPLLLQGLFDEFTLPYFSSWLEIQPIFQSHLTIV